MSAADPKPPKSKDQANATGAPPEEVTLNAHGFAATEPISDEHTALHPPLPPQLAEGEVIAGRYRIVRFVAHGGMGEVYEAEDQDLGERLALKTIREETRDAVAEERFKREIQLSRKVTHPNVCRIFDVGYHDQPDGSRIVFLTMELLGGETLLEYVRREGPVPLPDAARFMRQVVAALTAAHSVGVVHRDLKSGNVILAPRKGGGTRAVVTDFGLAHVLNPGEDGRSLSGSGGIIGTPGYMAPEQVEGGAITPRTDVYALGVVLYEMLTGKLPFDGETPLSIAAKRLVMPAPSPRVLRPDLPPRWERTVLACMEREPRSRPGSARAVLDLLEEDGNSTSVRRKRLSPGVRPTHLLAVGLLLAVLAVLGLRAWRGRPHALADELRRRGVSLGTIEPADAGMVAGYGVLLRNAVRTDLSFEIPVIDARNELELGDGRELSVGYARPRLDGEPFRIGGRFAIHGDGADRRVELTLRLIDPRTNELRAAVVEAGSLRHVADVVLHAGDRLRAIAGFEPQRRRPMSPAGRAAFDASTEAMRDGDLARALEIVEAAVAAEPETVELRFLLGRVLAGLELDVSSALAVQRASELGRSEDPFWGDRIEALRVREDATRSTQLLEQLRQRYPANIDLALDLSRVYLQAQRGEDATRLLDALEAQPLAPREQLRIAIERLIVAERLYHRDVVSHTFRAAQQRARELKLPGLEVAVLRIACTNSAGFNAPGPCDEICGELEGLAERNRLPYGVVAAEVAWPSVRASEAVDAKILDRARRARALATQAGGRRRLAEALNVFAMAARDTNSEEYDEELFHEALAVARDAHDHLTASAVLFNMSYYARADGRIADESRYLRETVELARDSGSKDMLSDALCRLADSTVRIGDVPGAQRLLDEALGLAGPAAADDPADECSFLTGYLLEQHGRYLEARARYEAMAALHERAGGNPAGRVPYYAHVADLDYLLGRWSQLVESSSRVITLAGKESMRTELRDGLILRAIAQVELGRKDEARTLPPFVRQRDDESPKLDRAWTDLLLAGLDSRLGVPPGEVEARIAAVIGVAVSAQHRPLELRARLERLSLLAREHDPALAQETQELIERADAGGFTGMAHEAAVVGHGRR